MDSIDADYLLKKYKLLDLSKQRADYERIFIG